MAHVAADSSSSSVVDQLSVRLGQEYRVKLGRSFTFPEQNSFHTIKYDFKPQSVDSTKPGHLKVTDDEVNVSLPVVSQGDSVEEFTHFRGNKKTCTKECILIINTQTGEAILEKISNNVNLKAVRDGRKPAPAAVNRDRSVSPSPFMMQSKGHSASKSQLSTSSGHRHLTPSPIPSATPTTSNNSTPSATKGGGASSSSNSQSSSNATQGNSSKKGQKRQTKSKTPKTPAIVPTKQESKGRNGSKPKAKKKSESSTNQASIPAAPKIKTEPATVAQQASLSSFQTVSAAMTSMPLLTTREISPIHSSNPTPEPIRPPSRKKQKMTLTRNSSSSSSDSSDSDSEGEEPMSQAPPIQQISSQFSSVPVTQVTNTQSQIQGSGNSMPVFSHSQPIAQKGHIAQKSHPGQPSLPKIPPPPNQRLSSGSSSGSDSDSSSGSSSSDSSSDSSDEENDKEVAAISRGPPVVQGQGSFRRSYSELKSDLQLSSDSGSSSD